LRKPSLTPLVLGGLAFIALIEISCGGKDVLEQLPAGPASAAALPTESPVPSGLPKTPAPVWSVSCSLGYGTDETECSQKKAQHIDAVDAAIDALVHDAPEIFDLKDDANADTRQYRVLDKQAYLAGVLHFLRQAGFCADVDYTTLEHIQVKNAVTSSEDYSIYMLIGSKGYIRRRITGVHSQAGSYLKTCSPAAFPLEDDPNAPPPGSGCGRPYPPPVTRFNVKIHVRNPESDPEAWVLDSTPIVGPRPDYCKAIGFTDGRFFCPVRAESASDRYACENFAVGIAPDTGQYGPTWSHFAAWNSARWEKDSGHFCVSREESGCARSAGNPYQLHVYPGGAGQYFVCTSDGSICGDVYVDN
jgi:hypothetical protein